MGVEIGASAIQIRRTRSSDIDALLRIIAEEGWYNSRDLLTQKLPISPPGVSYVAVDEKDTVLSHCCAVEAGRGVYIISWFITHRGRRGRGIGANVFNKCLQKVDSLVEGNATIALHSVKSVMDFYIRANFKPNGIFTIFCQGRIKTPDYNSSATTTGVEVSDLKDLTKEQVSLLVDYDKTIGQVSREPYLRRHLQYCDQVWVTFTAGRVSGYCGYKKLEGSHMISPLYADTHDVAQALAAKLCDALPLGTVVDIILPQHNMAARRLWARCGVESALDESISPAQLMFNGQPFEFQESKIYSVIGHDSAMV